MSIRVPVGALARLAALSFAPFAAQARTALWASAAACFAACAEAPLPEPAPGAVDVVEGAVLAAVEPSGAVRLYKVTHVDDYPLPVDYLFHLIVYEPTAPSFEAARALWARGEAKVFKPNIQVRRPDWAKRSYRVVKVEGLTTAERGTYESAQRAKRNLGM
jgi:hypothetical protein